MNSLFQSASNALGIQKQTPEMAIRGSIDEIGMILSNHRRREVIKILQNRSGPITLGELSEIVAEREKSDENETSNLRKSVYISLYQSHMNKLVKSGIVAFDTRYKEVSPGPQLENYAQLIEFIEGVIR